MAGARLDAIVKTLSANRPRRATVRSPAASALATTSSVPTTTTTAPSGSTPPEPVAANAGRMMMDEQQFDRWTRMLAAATSRRVARRALVGSTFAAGLAHLGLDDASAKKKRKKLKRNAFGCVDVGGKCRGKNSVCCSGICGGKKPKKGKKDRSTCRAHNVLDCPAGADACSQSASSCGTQNGVCNQTTGQASFCAATTDCFDCKKDADCEPEFGPGAACIVCNECGGIYTNCVTPEV